VENSKKVPSHLNYNTLEFTQKKPDKSGFFYGLYALRNS
jgi:hypothetical protein